MEFPFVNVCIRLTLLILRRATVERASQKAHLRLSKSLHKPSSATEPCVYSSSCQGCTSTFPSTSCGALRLRLLFSETYRTHTAGVVRTVLTLSNHLQKELRTTTQNREID